MLFAVPFYDFLFSRYLDLTKRHFLSDILVPFPDSSDLYSRVTSLFHAIEHGRKEAIVLRVEQ